MERGYKSDENFNNEIELPNCLDHFEVEDESSDDERDRDMQDFLAKNGDEMVDFGSFFQSEGSIHSSSSLNDGDRLLPYIDDNAINPHANLKSLDERQNASGGTLKKYVDYSNWEGQYHIDQWVETEQQSIVSKNLEKANDQSSELSLDKVVAYIPCTNGSTEYLDNEPEQQIVAVMNKGAGGDSNEKIRIQQLEVLYAARGREMQQLQIDLEDFKNEWTVENAALKQQLKETEEERTEYACSLEECQRSLEMANDRGAQIEGELRAFNMKCAAVEDSRNEILSKLQVAESTIESLHYQLKELEKCENFGRTRDNHAAFISNLQDKHRCEVHQLSEEMNDLREKLLKSNEDVNNLRTKLEKSQHDCEEIKIEKGETVNRLLKALEDSQEKCRNLVKSATSAITNEEQESLEFLKKELATANQELDRYRVQFATKTDEKLVSANSVNDNLISSLKAEMERSLAALSSKNDQLKKFQTEYHLALSQLHLLTERTDKTENELLITQNIIKELTNELNGLKLSSNTNSSAAAKEINQLKKEKKFLEAKLQESKYLTDDLISSKTQLNEVVMKLKQETIKLMNDKEIAVEECRKACLILQEDCVKKEAEAYAAYSKQTQKLHEEQTKKLIDELEDVKSLYVKICQEKDNLEKSLRNRWEIEKLKIKEDIEKIKNLEIMSLKGEYEKQLLKKHGETNIKNETITREIAVEVSKQVSERVQRAKQLWEKEQSVNIEAKVDVRAKEMLQEYLNGKKLDTSEAIIDEYLDQIKVLEKRVRETEELYRKHLSDMEANKETQKARQMKELEERLKRQHEIVMRDAIAALKSKFERDMKLLKVEFSNGDQGERLRDLLQSAEKQFKDVSVILENQREQLSKEFDERVVVERNKIIMEQKLETEKVLQLQLQTLSEAKEAEKVLALNELEERLCKELEDFLGSQKQRFLSALQSMQESHVKDKAEIQENYDGIIAHLKVECKKHHETTQLDLKRMKLDNLNHHELEQKSLLFEIEELKEKCRLLEKEKYSMSTKAQEQLRSTKNELEECKYQLEQMELDYKVKQEEQIIMPLRKDIASIQAKAYAAEEMAAKLRLQLEEELIKYKNLNDKYTLLKGKVKKYHRYIHGKEREFADNLAKLTLEYKKAIERILQVEGDAVEAMENRRGDVLNFLAKNNPNTFSNNRPQTPGKIINNKTYPERTKLMEEREKEEIKKTFVSSIEKLQGDIMKFLNDCSREAVDKIQEEVAKASWILSEQLHGSISRVNIPSSTSKQTSLYEGSRSGSDTPELPTNGSSGRGTMIGNSAGSASEGAAEPFLTYSQLPANKPLKFWSSTPFHPSNSHFTNISETPVATVNSQGYHFTDDIDVWPVSYKTNSQTTDITKTVQTETENPDDVRMTTLRNLTEQILTKSYCPPTATKSDEEQCVKKTQFFTLSSDLSAIKNEFWKSVNGNK
ncbi:hypothetical protein CHUAL_010271 [Chamberlinius hualienensis]